MTIVSTTRNVLIARIRNNIRRACLMARKGYILFCFKLSPFPAVIASCLEDVEPLPRAEMVRKEQTNSKSAINNIMVAGKRH